MSCELKWIAGLPTEKTGNSVFLLPIVCCYLLMAAFRPLDLSRI